ncbi:prepilin peptidase [Photobacterium damselae]|uniref:prepilin peptidase n=1 Tax=Photobacterium damselae TaxID=38293 RepID=UPI00406789F5
MLENYFSSLLDCLFQLSSMFNNAPLWLRVSSFALYSLAFGSFLGSILNRRSDPLKAAQDEREYVLLNYGTDIAPEIHPPIYNNQKYSICPNCRNRLRFYHNIPLISYFILKGRCGFCDQKISKSYPLIESSTLILMLLFGYTVDFNLSIQVAWFLIFSISTVSICYTDIKSLEVYDLDSVAFCVSGLSILNHDTNVTMGITLTSIYIISFIVLISIAWKKIRRFKDTPIASGDFPLMVMFLISVSSYSIAFGEKSNLFTFMIVVLLSTPLINLFVALSKKEAIANKLPFAPALTIATFLILVTKGLILL